ncbi:MULTISPECIES: hypothetical protein [unclassified Undibacterium]|uniref:hypothetical protein n=1 Tax=unclassified Undibacterium TaxID=2630295 RepID=UPI002AC96864|nr:MULTISPECIES: hypothetical protein [unclassified Undibacterium]MEB0140683.1 hypothetical protein [Undibacterium sp. CCC2.1]MEB0173701.1 hypothetical protein [Undibacterium sp. CCC1.1]MEB0177667.1 hypothetical protein [Undibacterium sp. CCC3.4]MEB0216868.1 hypothetical protein [Undibacterium sp. 5I2]WPX43367.1 hypothetical protein RHM61_18615 [Undibacterium sp. CCC3.4]
MSPRTLLCSLFLSLISWQTSQATDTAAIFIEGKQLHYYGLISAAANEQLSRIYQQSTPKPEWLSIKSRGGEIDDGIALGNWIADHKLHLQVLEYCLSSCANYVFPAANKKQISHFAIIGFHGGAASNYSAQLEQLSATVPDWPQQRPKWEAQMDQKRQRERAFYYRIHVDARLPIMGQAARFATRRHEGKHKGWVYSLAAYQKLGVHDVEFIKPNCRSQPDLGFFEIDADMVDVADDTTTSIP